MNSLQVDWNNEPTSHPIADNRPALESCPERRSFSKGLGPL